MEKIFATLIDVDGNSVADPVEIIDHDFHIIVADAKAFPFDVAIQLHTEPPTATNYWTSPKGKSYRPHWYKNIGRPKKDPQLKKQPVGLHLSKWVADALAVLPGSRQANIETAIIAHYKLINPEHQPKRPRTILF